MEGHRHTGVEREPEPGRPAGAADRQTLTILQRYAAGEISASEAAHELGPRATEHDVFAGILAAGLPLPQPAPEQLAREVAALQALYGPRGQIGERCG
ncbi:MAG: hypothetical protein WDN04_05625 [Rhodospirillales bacterium]